MDKLEERIRSLTILQLQILKAIADSEYGILDSQEIMNTTGSATATFGALIVSLKKFKNDEGQPIVLPAGATNEGMRWQLNEKVVSRERLKEIIAELNVDNIL